MKVVYYEMRKSWLKTVTLVVLIALTALNILRIYDLCRTKYSYTFGRAHDSYYRLYETVCGELTEKKITSFKNRAKELDDNVSDRIYSTKYQPDKYIYTGYEYGDYALYNLFVGPQISYAATYSNTSNLIAARAVDNYHFYIENGKSYEAEKNALIYQLYRNRSIPQYRTTYWTGLFFNYDFSSLLCIVMLILGLSASFTIELESGMFQLITAAGKNANAVGAKIISAAIYCAILAIYFTMCDLIMTHVYLGIDGLNMPLYSSQMFDESPFGFSFWETILLWIGIRFLALFAISLMILLISKITQNTIISMVGCFGASLIIILLTAVTKSVFNPVCALDPGAYIKNFAVMNILGKPILTLYVAIIVLVAECVILWAAIAFSRRILRR